jgi:trk system potassium uptake protein TrkA
MLPPLSAGRREFAVIGLGRFGSSVAKTLIRHGHDVLAVDSNGERVQALAAELRNVAQLDATNIEALRQIGIEHVDAALVCMGMDFESNLLATVLLLELGVPLVITKARTRTQKRILEAVGAHEVILPEQEAGEHLGRRLASRGFIDYLEVADGLSVVEVQAPAELHGHTLVECRLRRRYGLNVIAVHRDDDLIVNPAADLVIEPGDVLVVIGRLEDAERLQA